MSQQTVTSPADPFQAEVQNLISQYGYWEQHPKISVDEWQDEVREGNTRRSYWEYVATKLEENAAEKEPANSEN